MMVDDPRGEGYVAAMAGRADTACPYVDGTGEALQWKTGWKAGRDDRSAEVRHADELDA